MNDTPSKNTNRRALVTGSSRGIGRAIALALAKDGFELVIHYNKRKEAADEVVESIQAAGGSAYALCFDVSNREQVRSCLEQELATNGAFAGVVLNAGIAADSAFPALSGEAWDSVIATNLTGLYNVLQPLIMPMIHLRQGGRIVTISSVSGISGNRGQVNYSAAKAGIIGATKSLAQELAKREITVNCVAPGLIDTDMLAEVETADVLKLIPMRRLGKSEEVASLVSYLFSPGASYITAQVISVNGGMI